MNPLDYIAHETKRQDGTIREALGMYQAWKWWTDASPVISHQLFVSTAEMINGVQGYRVTPVYFRNGGHAANHRSIVRLLDNLIDAIEDETISFYDQREGYTVGSSRADVFTKEFLEIHPFTDGNGRVGSLLWNYLSGTLLSPQPMPYFFGDS